MSACQKCQKPIAALEGRWMFTPEGAPSSFHLDKCATCGEWTPEEEAKINAAMKQLTKQQNPGGCNCTGTR